MCCVVCVQIISTARPQLDCARRYLTLSVNFQHKSSIAFVWCLCEQEHRSNQGSCTKGRPRLRALRQTFHFCHRCIRFRKRPRCTSREERKESRSETARTPDEKEGGDTFFDYFAAGEQPSTLQSRAHRLERDDGWAAVWLVQRGSPLVRRESDRLFHVTEQHLREVRRLTVSV